MTLRSPLFSVLAAAVVAASTLAPPTARARPDAPHLTQSQAGYYPLKVGDVDVVALSDGSIGLDTKLLQTKDRRALDAALKQAFVASPLDTSVNAYLILLAGKTILVDAGTGVLFGPSLNKLPASLKAAGVEPGQVTDVVLTHVHTDHSGGLADGSRRLFPNAVVHLDRRELDFWLDPANEAKAPPAAKTFFQQARASLEPYVRADRVQTFDGATELFPGLRSMPARGHTPGHTFYRLESRGSQVVFWGDVMHVAEVQLHDPSIAIDYDVDPKAAIAQRRLAFADAAARGYLVAPAHMAFPGIGHLRHDGDGYRWVPLPYVNDADVSAR